MVITVNKIFDFEKWTYINPSQIGVGRGGGGRVGGQFNCHIALLRCFALYDFQDI